LLKKSLCRFGKATGNSEVSATTQWEKLKIKELSIDILTQNHQLTIPNNGCFVNIALGSLIN